MYNIEQIDNFKRIFIIKDNVLCWKYPQNQSMVAEQPAGKIYKNGIRYVKLNGIKYEVNSILEIM